MLPVDPRLAGPPFPWEPVGSSPKAQDWRFLAEFWDERHQCPPPYLWPWVADEEKGVHGSDENPLRREPRGFPGGGWGGGGGGRLLGLAEAIASFFSPFCCPGFAGFTGILEILPPDSQRWCPGA
jgi:hypothetical protein